MCPGAEPGADLGPLISPEAKQRVCDLVQSGVDDGANVRKRERERERGGGTGIEGAMNNEFMVGGNAIHSLITSYSWLLMGEMLKLKDTRMETLLVPLY